ncbi:MAG TPA: solute carrier family 23 protein [Acidobacteriaceae bacterium]|nr:solute carrier family 23 protein [Acidobacteriaceae bacterium]
METATLSFREERSVSRTARVKPANLTYSVEEAPPLPLTIVMGLQHVFVMSVGWIFVVVVATSIGASSPETSTMIRISMIASGIATILQARTRGPIGSGYLCPFSCGPAYISASILAGKAGGLPLVFGMTAFSGAFESVLSRVLKRLQKLFPPEVTGLVVAMVGLDLVGIGCPRFMGYAPHSEHLDQRAILVALLTLAAMVVPTLLTRSKLRLYPVLIGLSLGYLAAILTGTLTPVQMRKVLSVPLMSVPRLPTGHHFSFAMTLPFMIASICSILKTVGDLTFCEKINDTQWKRTDMGEISGGILAGGICSVISGLFGGLGQSTFSSNVGLSVATGATSRVISWPAGLICIGLAFFPRLAEVFSIMPDPVMGAVVVYVACFMVLGGIQVMLSRMLDARRIFVTGLALIFGLSVAMVPGLYSAVPAWLSPLFSSSLALATVLVVVLNLLLRLGTSKRKVFEIDPATSAPDESEIRGIMEAQGATWGMRPEVNAEATECLHELIIYLSQIGVSAPVRIAMQFDEFNLDLDVQYSGPLIRLPDEVPTLQAIASDVEAMPLLSAYILRKSADAFSGSSHNGRSRVHLHFDH